MKRILQFLVPKISYCRQEGQDRFERSEGFRWIDTFNASRVPGQFTEHAFVVMM